MAQGDFSLSMISSSTQCTVPAKVFVNKLGCTVADDDVAIGSAAY